MLSKIRGKEKKDNKKDKKKQTKDTHQLPADHSRSRPVVVLTLFEEILFNALFFFLI